jgi:hypothetical protein
MGVAPEAMAEIFGYRLKEIDKYIFGISIFVPLVR